MDVPGLQWRALTPETPSSVQCPMSTNHISPQITLNLITPPSSSDEALTTPVPNAETPRTHRLSSSVMGLTSEIHMKLRIDLLPNAVKRRSSEINEEDPLSSPRKRVKLHLITSSPKKLSPRKRLNIEKENSPIKLVDSFGQTGFFANKAICESRLIYLKPSPPIPIDDLTTSIDFFHELQLRNLYEVIRVIFSYLSPKDLVHICAVSKCWRNLCMILQEEKRIKDYKTAVVTSKENSRRKQAVQAEILEKTPTKRFPLTVSNDCQNAKRNVLKSPLLSPNSKRFNYFVKEGEKLDRKETLQKCPRCQYPARVNISQNFALCALSGCKFKFCPQCKCSAHPEKLCNYFLSSSPQRKLPNDMICSKVSKRRLRRL